MSKAAMTYERYISSDQWRKLRTEVLQRDGHKCALCGDDERRLEVHHLEYPPTLGRDSDGSRILDVEKDCAEKLITVCVVCHDVFTSEQRAVSLWSFIAYYGRPRVNLGERQARTGIGRLMRLSAVREVQVAHLWLVASTPDLLSVILSDRTEDRPATPCLRASGSDDPETN